VVMSVSAHFVPNYFFFLYVIAVLLLLFKKNYKRNVCLMVRESVTVWP
jgi:hypothetical protein